MNNKTRAHTIFMASVPKKLLQVVNHQRAQNLKDKLWDICLKNQSLLNVKSATFLFQGEWYSADGHSTKHSDHPNRALDPDLRIKVDELINNKEFDEIVENQHLLHLFSQLTMDCQHIDDYYGILPSQFESIIAKFNEDIVNIGQPMMKHQIDDFRARNEQAFICINEIFIRQLLMMGE